MKVKDTDLKNILGKRIKIKDVSNTEDKHLIGLTGNVSNPFNCFGEGCVIGVFLDPSDKVDNDICNLTLEDDIEFIKELY